jgi:Ca-activated chloride channel family protein
MRKLLFFVAGALLPISCGYGAAEKQPVEITAESMREAEPPETAGAKRVYTTAAADEAKSVTDAQKNDLEIPLGRVEPAADPALNADRPSRDGDAAEKSARKMPAPPPVEQRIEATKSEDKKSSGPSLPMQPAKLLARPSIAQVEEVPAGGDFAGREVTINAPTLVAEDAQSTFAIDVDTAAYSIARRSLVGDRLPTASLVRIEEMVNYFHYDYEPPVGERHPFSIQAEGARSPVDATKYILRVGVQARVVQDKDRLPANLVFLVDTSCSMTSEDRLDLAKRSLKMAVENLTAKDTVAITTYAGGVRVVLPPTNAAHKKDINRAIDSLRPGGGTAMESGLTLAYKQAAKMLRDNSITRIIVCSDGDANIGATGPADMLQQVEGYVKEGVTLSTIGFGDGNYKDETMETLANRGNGNYYYIDTPRMAERVFGRDLTKMIQDVAQDVKIQVEMDPAAVYSYRLVGYENRAIADRDFRNDKVDAGEIGAGHQVTALYELTLKPGAEGSIATVRVRAKEPRGMTAKETSLLVPASVVTRVFEASPEDFRFAVAVMGGSELLRQSPHAGAWTFNRVLSLVSDIHWSDPDRTEFLSLMKKAAYLSGETPSVSMR